MPDPPPVTTASLPAKLFMRLAFWFCVHLYASGWAEG
jgi:hypothetical protein